MGYGTCPRPAAAVSLSVPTSGRFPKRIAELDSLRHARPGRDRVLGFDPRGREEVPGADRPGGQGVLAARWIFS
jgi:hypothetical protein